MYISYQGSRSHANKGLQTGSIRDPEAERPAGNGKVIVYVREGKRLTVPERLVPRPSPDDGQEQFLVAIV